MMHDGQSFDQTTIRGTDSYSLLRLYDRARDFVAQSASQSECARAGKLIERIAKELLKRKVSF